MEVIPLCEIQRALDYRAVIARMREAIAAYRAGECDMPMPMHLDIAPEHGEVHIKSSYRRGGKYFALKVASTFPNNLDRGLSTGGGMMLLCSAQTGQPVALLADEGHLTDVRTAAVAAKVAQDLGRKDTVLGILGTGIQARLQARGHVLEWAEVIEDLERVQYVEVEHTGKRFLLRSELQVTAGRVLQAVGVAVPPTVQQLT